MITTLRCSMGCAQMAKLQMERSPISKNCYVVPQFRIPTLRCSIGCAQMAKFQMGRFLISESWDAGPCGVGMHACVTCFFRVRCSFMVLQTYQTMPDHTPYDCECGMVLRSVTHEAIQAHFQGKTHKKRMQESEPWQDYECDCGANWFV